MKYPFSKSLHIQLFIVMAVFIVSAALPGYAAEEYEFAGMWPNLPQPWYFQRPEGVAVDSFGNVYVADTWNDQIYKFSVDGDFLGKWGDSDSQSGDGNFSMPYGIAVGPDGNVYVADTYHERIQKFSPQGVFLGKWKTSGDSDSDIIRPRAIAASSDGNVYVTDSDYSIVKKFSSQGVFLGKWGSWGSGQGQFNEPKGIAADAEGNVYVVDNGNYRIQKFDSNGNYLLEWGSEGDAAGQFAFPLFYTGLCSAGGIAVDGEDRIYVADSLLSGYRIQIFDSQGLFLGQWKGGEDSGNYFAGLAIDGNGVLYGAESCDSSIVKFGPTGTVLEKWTCSGTADGMFSYPMKMALDDSGNVYVVDYRNCRIQKFNPQGVFLGKWGNCGEGDGEFHSPEGIAVDGNGHVYVGDIGNSRIQKFDSQGVFLSKWDDGGNFEGNFFDAQGIAIDEAGDIYVAGAGTVDKFDSNGVLLDHWDTDDYGWDQGQLESPTDIAMSPDGNVFVLDFWDQRIQKFTPDGIFLDKLETFGETDAYPYEFKQMATDAEGNIYVPGSKYRIKKISPQDELVCQIGSIGTDSGHLATPWGTAVSKNGLLYVSEAYNHRIQVFKKKETPSKAIIVTGSGPTDSDLDNGFQFLGNLAYTNLFEQGYDHDRIRYLANWNLPDLDENGFFDDRDGEANKENLEKTITEWASDAGNLLIYLLGHGGQSGFRINASQIVSPEALDSWLDDVQNVIPGAAILIYDGCQSGVFAKYLKCPAEKQRVLVFSAKENERAIFGDQGTISFSSFFWSRISGGDSFYKAFTHAENSVGYYNEQDPCLDMDGNGLTDQKSDTVAARDFQIGNRVAWLNEIPGIGGITPPQSIEPGDPVTIFAENVVDEDGIEKVTAAIVDQGSWDGPSDQFVTDLLQIELLPVGNDRYQTVYKGFTQEGVYRIAITARDKNGAFSIPYTVDVNVGNVDANGSGTLYFPFARSDGFWETEIGVVNTSTSSGLSGAFFAYDGSGTAIGFPKTVYLQPLERTALTVGQAFPTPEQIRYVAFQADAEHMAGYQRPRYEKQYKAAVPASFPVETDRIYVPHIASTEVWWTLISLVNTDDEAKGPRSGVRRRLHAEYHPGRRRVQAILRERSVRGDLPRGRSLRRDRKLRGSGRPGAVRKRRATRRNSAGRPTGRSDFLPPHRQRRLLGNRTGDLQSMLRNMHAEHLHLFPIRSFPRDPKQWISPPRADISGPPAASAFRTPPPG